MKYANKVEIVVLSLPETGGSIQPILVEETLDLLGYIKSLEDRSFLVERESGFEVSEDGKQQRATVKFQPREGLLSKLINRFNVSVGPKNFLYFGGPLFVKILKF